jgi:hypothetical protein
MQQYSIRRTLTRAFCVAGAFAWLLSPLPLLAQCASPVARLSTAQIQEKTAFAGLFAFAEANRICLGIELDDNDLLQTRTDLHLSDVSGATAFKHLLGGHPRYMIVNDGLVSIRPTAAKTTWLDLKIHSFKIPRTDIQTANNALFLSIQQQIAPREGYAGHFRAGDPKDMVGPFDAKDKTVRELLNLIVTSSKGAAWVTTGPYVRTQSPPGNFWRIIEYSSTRQSGSVTIQDLERQIVAGFVK